MAFRGLGLACVAPPPAFGRAVLCALGLALTGLLPASPVAGADCQLALLLAIDVSGSVDDGEYRLQTEGTAAALRDPEIAATLVQGRVALSVVQWSSTGMQKVVQPWRRMESPRDLADFADAAALQERAFGKADTAVSDAISFAVRQFDSVPDCPRRVIDISGDGVQNTGAPLPDARRAAIAAGITINAIAIEGIGLAISEFYRRHVITDGGFVITATTHSDYPRAIRLKILREISVPLG